MNEYLFIGGPADGQRIATADRSLWSFPIRKPLHLGTEEASMDACQTIQVATYRRVRIEDTFLYVLQDEERLDVIHKLIEHYRPGVAIDLPQGVCGHTMTSEQLGQYEDYIANTGSSTCTLLLPVSRVKP